MADPDQIEQTGEEPANLKFLRRLVTTLTATMIFGLIAIFSVLVMRLNEARPGFPETLALPDDTHVVSITRAEDFILVIGQDNQVFVLSADGTEIRQIFTIDEP